MLIPLYRLPLILRHTAHEDTDSVAPIAAPAAGFGKQRCSTVGPTDPSSDQHDQLTGFGHRLVLSKEVTARELTRFSGTGESHGLELPQRKRCRGDIGAIGNRNVQPIADELLRVGEESRAGDAYDIVQARVRGLDCAALTLAKCVPSSYGCELACDRTPRASRSRITRRWAVDERKISDCFAERHERFARRDQIW